MADAQLTPSFKHRNAWPVERKTDSVINITQKSAQQSKGSILVYLHCAGVAGAPLRADHERMGLPF